jgi:diacylglycerol kinase (ATP)
MSERVPVIMNPEARSAGAGGRLAVVAALRPEPEIFCTTHPGHAVELARCLALEGRPLVVAAGGDGTVNEVLQGLAEVNAGRGDVLSHTALGVLPAGTMNVFAYEMGFKSHRDLVAPWRVITSGKRRCIDLWMANEHFFLQMAGVGLDAEIVRATTSEAKRRLGPLAYGVAAVEVLRKEATAIRVSSPGRPDLQGCAALLGNGRHYGGPVPVFPQAALGDGLLDLILLREPSLNAWHAVQALRSVLTAGYEGREDLDYLQLAEMTISAESEVALELDGELMGCTPVHFRRAAFPLTVAAL